MRTLWGRQRECVAGDEGEEELGSTVDVLFTRVVPRLWRDNG
ncbi:Uncharacterised protein [Dermatophilus congolensis]|uniref:Uncharacterized protein n=1 Tax=Dermatophilus congolensis TaxID=1863 RepID=A0A239VMZ9_9MICO|nr:Uncharacterised protein [Dermatophilus congolensis]